MVLTLTTLFCGCQPREFTTTGIYFDTLVELTAYGEAVPDSALELCRKYDALLSVTNPDSDIYKLNHQGEYEVQPETLDIIQKALSYCEKSEGLFDISIEPVSSLWDFTAENPTLPKENDIKTALKAVGYQKIKIDGKRVSLPSSGGIDLGAIAKGYIADEILRIYEEHSLSGIINLGGNILTVGKKTSGESFKVGIKKPFSDGDIACNLEFDGGSVVTCGVYERYFTLGGKNYHHILNPKTGYPEIGGIDSVTVICESSTEADALSTTLFLMGEANAKAYLRNLPDTHAIFVRTDGNISLSQGLEMQGNTVKIK